MKCMRRKLLVFCFITAFIFGASLVHGEEQKEDVVQTISAGKRVSLEFSIVLENKEVVSTNKGKEPLSYVQGENQIFPALEKGLEGMAVGETKNITLAPEEAYGQRVEEAVVEVNSEQLPLESRQVGAMVQGQNAAGQPLHGIVTVIDGDKVTIDLNHPLAGKTITYEIKVLAIQDN